MKVLNIFKTAKEADVKVSSDKVAKVYKLRQISVLFSISIGYLGYYAIRLVFTTEQKDIMEVYGLSKSQIGLVLACFGIGYGISKLFMGALADKANPRFYLAFGLYLSCIFNVFLGSVNNVYIMMFLMVLISITQGMGAPACQKTIQLWWSKKMRGTVYAVWSSAHNFGAFACVAVVQMAIFLFNKNLPAVFYTASVVSAVIATFIIIFGRDRPVSVGLPDICSFHKENKHRQKSKDYLKDVIDLPLQQIFIKYIVKNKVVWLITLTSMALYLVRYGIMSWIPLYLSEYKGFDANWAKWLVGVFELAAVPGVILLGFLSDLLKGRRTLVCLISSIGLLGSLLVYILSTNHSLIVVSLIVMGNLIYAPITLVGLMVNESVPKFAVGSSTGFMGFFQYIVGEVCATALIGILVDLYGWNASNSILFGSVILVIVLLSTLMWVNRE
jgi:OPA family glycerol-3-phosphate transporter-like MFS transporter